jgi:hypothetical protein
MIETKLNNLINYEKICNIIGIDVKSASNIYICDSYSRECYSEHSSDNPGLDEVHLIMLNYCYFLKEHAYIKNIVIDVSDPDHPTIFSNSFPYIKEFFYKPYDPLTTSSGTLSTRVYPKSFSNISFGPSSEFILSTCNNLVRCTYHPALEKWFFSTSKKIDDVDTSTSSINTNVLNKKYIYTFNITTGGESQLICVHTHSGIYTRKLPLHFFKSVHAVMITTPDELIEKIRKYDSILYFNPKIRCYIKLINTIVEPMTEQLNYLIKRATPTSPTTTPTTTPVSLTSSEQKIEKDIKWLPEYILNCYHRKLLYKNLKFDVEEFYIIRKIYGSENLLEKIENELSKSSPKQLDNLIRHMYEYYETCIS